MRTFARVLAGVLSVWVVSGVSAYAETQIPGSFLVTLQARSNAAAAREWIARRGGLLVPIRGSTRLWEVVELIGYSEQDLAETGLFDGVEQDHWVETVQGPLLPEAPFSLLPESFSFFAPLDRAVSISADSTRYPSELKPGANWALERIQAPQAWIRRTSTDDIVVAVLDSGVDITHPDLKDNIWINPREIAANGLDDDKNGWVDDIHGYDSHYEKVEVQDEVGHGTSLAGIIGAVGDNSTGTTGVAWKTRMMVVRGDDHRRMSWTGAVKGAYYARDNGAKVINASWGTYSATMGLREMVRDMESSGVMVVNAVGNNGNNIDTEYRAYPAGYATSNLIVVTGLHPNGGLVHYADYGPKYVHIAAPGWANPTTMLGGKYGVQAGCSVAAPYVTGAVALLWAEHPDWTHQQVRERLFETVDPVPALRDKVATGGVLNVARALGVSGE
jgi:subtilisin family serine protease